jgi:hypothetical protein
MRTRAALGLLVVALATGCLSAISLADAGVSTDPDTREAGWMRIRSLRFGVALALPGTPFVREQVDEPRLRREGVVLALTTDAEAHAGYEVRLFRYAHDEEPDRLLERWGEEMFGRVGGQLEGEVRAEIGQQPGIIARYSHVGARADHLWVIAASDGRSVVEVIARNVHVPAEGADAAELSPPPGIAPIVSAIAFGR